MAKDKLEITPATKVHDLLVDYPELEDTLIGMAPPFRKLQNPLLRKSVAKVATLKHISSVANIPLNDLISKLRDAVGQSDTEITYEDEDYFTEQPGWFASDKIAISINEENAEDPDKMTLAVILQRAKELKDGEIIELITTFLPAPGIDQLRSQGYAVWTRKEDGGVIKSYFMKT